MKTGLLLGLSFVVACASGTEPIPSNWPPLASTAPMSLGARPPAPMPAVHVVGNRLFNGEKALTPEFIAIDSFDVSEQRKEVVFSAKRAKSFDIGLVSVDGSDIHWIPEDPADEVAVQWAPRGNKVSYIVHMPSADIVRTVHIPTSAQLSVDFPFASVHDLRWEPMAERYAVVVGSPDASERIESVKYDGTARRTDTPPAVRLDVTIDPLAGGIVLRPPTMRYGEKLPLVVRVDPHPFEWSDLNAAIVRSGPVALAIVARPPDAAWWRAARDVKWLDLSRPIVIGTTGEEPGVTYIAPSATVASDVFARRGSTLFVAPGRVQSFAAGYVAQQLKGIPPPNGRR